MRMTPTQQEDREQDGPGIFCAAGHLSGQVDGSELAHHFKHIGVYKATNIEY
jgi:hypothetical protein